MKGNFFAILRSRLDAHGTEAVAALRRSTFGIYLNYDNRTTQSKKCMNYLVSRQVNGTPDPDPNAIWFKVRGQIIRFSRIEFALISGLKFGQSQFNPYQNHQIPATSVYTRLFNNNKMKSIQLWDHFRNDRFIIANAADCVKLCKVLIAAHVVLGLDPNNWKIPEWIWVLVEDEQEWDRFPWGSISYQVLIRAITNAKKEPTKYKGYHLHGNTLALLVCIYYFINIE